MLWLMTAAWFAWVSCVGLALLFAWDSLREGEKRAAGVAVGAVALLLVAGLPLLAIDYPGRGLVVALLLGLCLLGIATLVLPFGRPSPPPRIPRPPRVDERDALFHRFYRLEPGTPEFEAYYAEHPESKEPDDEVRAMPPMAAPGSRTHDPLASPLSEVLDGLTGLIARSAVEGRTAAEKLSLDPDAATARLEGFARFLGADLVGTTTLDPAWVYSHVGRGPGEWGSPIELDHSHALVVAVRMRHPMVRHAPALPTMTETTVQYLESAKIAAAVAAYVRQLGYRARAHVDGNYRVMCVPVAIDAGLGELGRLGLLMTPEFGPRVRLAVVTTDLPLVNREPHSFGARDFCTSCLKCADACPSRSIDGGSPSMGGGVAKWRSEQDGCYRYWRIRGSDCGLCVRVCPYAHPSSPSHDLVRWVIRRNPLARRLALWADDLAYGRATAPRKLPPPPWHG